MKKLMMLMIVFSMFMTVACSPKMIKGTNIEETPDSKEILNVFAHYLKGFKEQNPDIYLEYVSKNYYDTNGTDEANDDVDYDKLIEILNSDIYHSLEKVSMTAIVKDLFFNDAGNKADGARQQRTFVLWENPCKLPCLRVLRKRRLDPKVKDGRRDLFLRAYLTNGLLFHTFSFLPRLFLHGLADDVFNVSFQYFPCDHDLMLASHAF